MHRHLHLDDVGRHYSELAASWIWVLALGGIILWWRQRRSVRRMFAPDLAAKKGVRRTRGWHAATSTVTARSDFADWPLLAQLNVLGIQAHMGVLFGVTNQILLALLAIGLLCVILWGYRMCWQRRPTRTGRRHLVGTAPARGTWLGLPAWAVAVRRAGC